MTEADVREDLDRALAATEAVVAGIRADQWAAPTPCTELDVRGVLNHLVRGNLLFVAIIRDRARPERGTDHLGEDPLAAYRLAATQLREAFATSGVLESVYAAPFGTAPGAALAHVRVVEVLVHGWDLARATGQAGDFPDDVAERALAGSRKNLTSRPQGPDAPFAAEVEVPPDAPGGGPPGRIPRQARGVTPGARRAGRAARPTSRAGTVRPARGPPRSGRPGGPSPRG
jgi:uncharacterized protein (TIGR03086 family)